MSKKYFILFLVFSCSICYINSFLCNSSTSKLYYPIKKDKFVITSTYGYRDALGSYHFHDGVDFAAPENTPIYSAHVGVVTYSGFHPTAGNIVIILHDNGYKSFYGHLSSNRLVSIGDYVSANQIIAYVGPKILPDGRQNGITTGPHLHFSIYDNNGNTVNPLDYDYI